MTPGAFRWRALTSVLIAGAFLALAFSGALLFVAPPGRIANWTDWSLLGLTKHQWIALHICFSALFLVVTVLHLIFNWRPMVGYFRVRVTRRLGLRLEWVVALAICVLVVFGALGKWPPFTQLLAWNEDLKAIWDEPTAQAPVPHAELLTLAELAEKGDVDLEPAVARLRAAGADDAEPETQVRDIATQMGVSAQRVYEILTGGDQAPAGGGKSAQGPGHGGGMGQLTLEQYCAQQGVALVDAVQALESAGYQVQPSQTLREVAVDNGIDRPYELVELLRAIPAASEAAEPSAANQP